MDFISNPLVDKAFAVVIVFILLKFLREDIKELTDAVNQNSTLTSELITKLDSDRQHQTNRMTEIRENLREMIRMWANELKK